MTTNTNNTYNNNRPKMQTKSSFQKRGMSKQATVWITKPSATKFEQKYIKLKPIGEAGSFGKAFRIKCKSDNKILAVKEISKGKIYRLHPSDKMRQSLLKSMEAEIDIMRRLNHKYIVNMFETFETKHTLHIIMEECTGGELFDRIKQRGRYNENDCKPIIKQICEALFYMHDKHRVVHCDLKPDNILFVNDNENSPIKIIDFGMSKVLPRLSKELRQLCGTPYYTAPEIIQGKYTHSCDMWSVGVIAYVMIFGFPPFYVDPNKYFGIKETKEIYKLILKGFNPNIKKGYGAWYPKSLSDRLSKNGMDFIAGLMQMNVGKRLTAKEALAHPWLNSYNSNEYKEDDSMRLSDLNATPFANFCTSHQFKYAISGLFRDHYKNMRPKHFENLKQLFSELDTDGNGKISYKEFEYGMLKCKDLQLDKNKIKQMFNSLDLDKNGEIAFENLLDATVHDYLVASDVRLYEAFRDLDIKETGKISLNELKKKIIEMNVYDNINHILSIIDDVDLDGDGTIDYQEFLRALHPDFNPPKWFPWKDTQIDEKENSVSNSSETEITDYIKDIESIQPKPRDSIDMNMDMKINNDELIIKEGWMQKEGKIIRSWRKRYFKLQKNGKMGYYHHENEQHAIATFNVKKLTKLARKSWSNTNKKRYGIKVYTPHRDWKFLCQNDIQRKEWINAIASVSNYNIHNNSSQRTNNQSVKPSRSK